ncbi:MAG TPA: hypothetical protein VG013_21155 [Gemmataceae bacterium]|nr:hypothetical protein [Gemmataceae bacterium]
MSEYDSPWKEALDNYFEPFMAFFFPRAHAEIDWARGHEALDKELQQVVREAELGRRVVDKLVKVRRTGGQEEWVLVHVEVQSQEESDFARRMYVYNYRLFDRYNRRVASLAVLGDERPSWRPDRFSYSLWDCTVGIQFPAVKLLDYSGDPAALEADPNPFAALVLAHLKTQETRQDATQRRAWKVRLVRGLYDRGFTAEDVRRLFGFIDWMMDLPPELEEQFWQEVVRYEEEKRMPYVTSVERRALEQGREEGRVAGREEGRVAGREEGLRQGIETALELRFGAAGLQFLPEIRALHDAAVLQAILQAIKTAATPEELRRVWA